MKYLAMLLLAFSVSAFADIAEEDSLITPFKFIHGGQEYMIGVWEGPDGPAADPFFALTRYEGDQWLFVGTRFVSENIVDGFGGKEAFLKYTIGQWNQFYFKDEVELPSSFFAEFGMYLHAHLDFLNGKLVFVD